MERGLLAPLSAREENALRRIFHGSPQIADVHKQRLMVLGLIREGPLGLQITELGEHRLTGLGHDAYPGREPI